MAIRRNIIISVIAVSAAAVLSIALASRGGSPVKVNAYINRDRMLVGESVRYSLDISADRGLTVKPAEIKAAFPGFVIRQSSETARDAGSKRIYRYRATVSKDEPGDFKILPVEVRYKKEGSAEWDAITARGFDIKVKSVVGALPGQETTSITIGGEDLVKERRRGEDGPGPQSRVMEVDNPSAYDIREPAGPKGVWTIQDILFTALLAGAGLVIIVFGAGFLYERFTKRATPPLPPGEVAMQRLGSIKVHERYAMGEAKAVYAELYGVMKEYVRSRFGAAKTELTTGEFIEELSGIKDLQEEEKKDLADLARICDLAKYSEHTPAESAAESAVSLVRALVEKTAVPLKEGQ